MEEKESKKYIKYKATLDGIGTFESPVLENSFIEKIRVDIVEKTDYLILQAINTIGGKRYRHITVDKNKVLDALTKATPLEVVHNECETAYLCPTCDHTVFVNNSQMSISGCHDFGLTPEFCSRCGQRLDWSEVK